MAILLEGCDGAPVIWGRLGEYVIQRTKKGRLSLRRYVKPGNPRTVKQQSNRQAFREGLSRWSRSEKISHGGYWIAVAKEKGFRDGYRAFISSFMLKYHSLSRDLSSEALALDWVKNDNNRIIYEESLSRKVKQKKSEDLNAVVLAYRHGQDFLSQYKESHRYLLDKGWDGKMRYGFVPKLDLSTEFMIINLGLVNTT